jgi:hypothetical protein
MDRLSKAKDRAFGPDRLKLMDEEIAAQEQMIELQRKYVDELE